MRPLTDFDVQAELSYAYIHAVASFAKMSCKVSTRHEDNSGIDALITAWGPFEQPALAQSPVLQPRQEVDIKIQLKATRQSPREARDNHFSFDFPVHGKIGRYNDLCEEALATPRFLIVLFLPNDTSDWLNISSEKLSMKKSAYWMSLSGATKIENAPSSKVVYLPQAQLFTPENLTYLMRRIAYRDFPRFQEAV